MDFLHKMKSREILEMSLKTIMAFLICIILIILMEGMIYGIYMNKIENNKSNTTYIIEESVAYCEEIEEGEYQVYLCTNEEQGVWHMSTILASKDEIESKGYKNVIWNKPTAFDVSITPVHYVIMGVFIVVVLGFYGWRFYKLNKEYIGFEKKLKKTGSIF